MPINKQGIWTYSDSDVVQSWPIFMNLGFNSVSEVVKGLQDGRVIIAKNDSDREAKLKPLRDAAGKNPDVIIYQADRKTVSAYSDGRYTTIFGGPIETDYVTNTSMADYFYRYQNANADRVNGNFQFKKAGLWLVSASVTFANDFNAQSSFINCYMSLGGKEYHIGRFNTYTINSNVMFVNLGNVPYHTTTDNQSIGVQFRVTCSPSSNIGWGGVILTAAKIG